MDIHSPLDEFSFIRIHLNVARKEAQEEYFWEMGTPYAEPRS